MSGIEEYLTLPILAHLVNFAAALFITLSTGAPGRKSGLATSWAGRSNMMLLHPWWLKVGMWLLVIGFFLQLVIEILKV